MSSFFKKIREFFELDDDIDELDEILNSEKKKPFIDSNISSYEEKIVDNSSYVDLNENFSIIMVTINKFAHAQSITNHLQTKKTVIVDLKDVTSEEGKRIIDFICGTTYALNGTMQKIGDSLFLFAPNKVDISHEDYTQIDKDE